MQLQLLSYPPKKYNLTYPDRIRRKRPLVHSRPRQEGEGVRGADGRARKSCLI